MTPQKFSEERTAGYFEIHSGRMIISDPCYNKTGWCTGELNLVKMGSWKAIARIGEVRGWGKRCWELIAIHCEHAEMSPDKITENAEFDIGVDSGQCGVYDSNHFPEEKGEYSDKNSWYRKVCEITHQVQGGVIKGGYVTPSGFGDGGYECFVKREQKTNQVIGVRVIFISDKDFEEIYD